MQAAMAEPVLLVDREGPVVTVTLNRPSTKNALNTELVAALCTTLPDVVRDRTVRAVVLTGAGGAFCSGADLKSGMTGSETAALDKRIDEMHSIIRLMIGARQPFIAAVDGAAVGFGCDLALACDLRVLSTRAYLQEIFVKIGLMPDGGGTFCPSPAWGSAVPSSIHGHSHRRRLGARSGSPANRVVDVTELEGTAAGSPPSWQSAPLSRRTQARRAGGRGRRRRRGVSPERRPINSSFSRARISWRASWRGPFKAGSDVQGGIGAQSRPARPHRSRGKPPDPAPPRKAWRGLASLAELTTLALVRHR
jgi:hypothetical protein